MRRSPQSSPPGLVLLGLGVFLLVLAPLLTWYVAPHAERTPVDIDSTSVLTGSGSYFDQGALKTRNGRKLTITRRVLGDVAASEKSGRAVWDVSQTIDNPETAKLNDPRKSFQWTTERWVTDRETNLPVRCCRLKPRDISGEAYLKWPFGVEEREYTWWDGNLGAAVPLRYAGRTTVGGYEGLRFTGTVKPARSGTRQVPGVLVDRPDSGQVHAEEWYANSRIEFVVDQRTGRILNTVTAPKVTLRAPGGKRDEVVLLRSDKLEFTRETQREAVELAGADSAKLKLLGDTAPPVTAAAGGVSALAGLVLTVRGRRERSGDA